MTIKKKVMKKKVAKKKVAKKKTAKKKEVIEVIPPGAPLPDDGDPDIPVAPVPDKPQMKCGYVIGIQEDGTFVFDILGTAPGVMELLGLHNIVGERLEARMDRQLGGKFSLVLGRLDKILEIVTPKEEEAKEEESTLEDTPELNL
jgi:hypothetical protein